MTVFWVGAVTFPRWMGAPLGRKTLHKISATFAPQNNKQNGDWLPFWARIPMIH
jgi:hypothetical protein